MTAQHRSMGLAAAALACLLATPAFAQANRAAGAAEPVATTQQKANEAMREAVPARNVGTVVRTGETPAQAASAALSRASAAVTPDTRTTTVAPAGNTGVMTTTPADGTAMAPRSRTYRNGTVRRAPRADRG